MRLVTNSEMRVIDKWAIKKLRIPGIVLMENAGRGSVDVLEDYFELADLKILIVCGLGNNGGDGFVMARHLQNRGAVVKIILTGQGRGLKGDALVNYQIAKALKIDITETTKINIMKRIINSFDPAVIVDAVFGTGFKGAPQGFYYKIIELINNSDAFILSIDIPSGVSGDNGKFEKTCVIADATATMCLPKRGHYLYPGRALCGNLHIVDIGVPYESIDEGYPRVIEFEDVHQIMPFRPPDGNKGTFGQVLIIAGARGYSGAAAMAALATLKTGAGLVRLAAPRGIIDVLESKLLEVVKVPLPQTDAETISPKAIEVLRPLLKTSDVVVIGPGITTHDQTVDFLFQLLPGIKKPLIIDADGLNICARDIKSIKKIRAPFILTPHPGELSRLIRKTPSEINERRLDLAPEYARRLGGIIILKGAPTVIASPQGEIYLNPTGNSGLASAGSGDVLVGIVAGLLAQGLSLLDASRSGVFIHGLAADLAMDTSNEYSLMASDLIDYIPRAINHVMNQDYLESTN